MTNKIPARTAFVLLLGLLLGLWASPAYPQSVVTKSQLLSSIAIEFPDNTAGALTPADLRTVTNNMVVSLQAVTSVNSQTGTSYAISVNDNGKLITFDNASPVAVSLPQATGDFGVGYNFFVRNKGAGTVTITPSTSTINGAASIALGNSASVYVVSDGTNYQVWGLAGSGTVTTVTCGRNLDGGTITGAGTCSLTANVVTESITVSNTGLRAFDTNESHFLAIVPGSNLTANRTFTVTTGDADRTLTVAGNINIASDFITSGANSLTLTTTGPTNVTFPTAGTLATLAGAETLTNKIMNGLSNTFSNIGLSSLASQSNNTIVANISGGAASPSAVPLTSAVDTISNQQGSILYRNAATWVALSPGTTGQVLSTNGAGANPTWTTVGGTGTVTSVTCGTGLTGGTFTTSGTCAIDKATNSNVWSAASDKVLTSDIVFNSAGALTSLTDAATIAVDMNTGFNFSVILAGNRTLGNPTNTKVGQTGCIFIVQGSGSNTLAYASNWKFAGGTAPILTTTASAVDVLCYIVRTSSFIWGNLTKDVR